VWALDPVNSPDLLAALRPHGHRADFEVVFVGAGWRDLVLECHRRIEAVFPDYELLAVKEKFGQLEFQAFPRPWIKATPNLWTEPPRRVWRLQLLRRRAWSDVTSWEQLPA
jgi:hypothetical protein